MRRCALVFALLVSTVVVGHATTSTMDLTVSGNQNIATIDANENGTIGDAGDCVFGAQIEMSGQMTVTGTQGTSPNPLRVCQGPCMGYGALGGGTAMTTITGCDWNSLSPGAPFVPACMEFGPSVPSSSSSSCTDFGASSGAAQGDPGGDQLEVTAGRLFYPGSEFIIPDPGFGFLCNAGGPAVEITTISGRRVVTDLTVMGESPQYACVKVPFELTDGSKKLLDACVPLTDNGNISYALNGGEPFAMSRLMNGLVPCSGRNAAPAASDLGLVVMGLALLGVGAWALGRRRGFSASLPL